MIVRTRPISISFTNTRRLNSAQSALFTPGSDYETERASDIYLIAEPWWHIGDQPNDPHFSVKEQVSIPFYLHKSSLQQRGRACLHMQPTCVLTSRFSTAMTWHRIWTSSFSRFAKAPTHPPFLLVDLYNQDPPDAEGAVRTFQRYKRIELPDMPMAIAMDANEHHHLWDSFSAGTSQALMTCSSGWRSMASVCSMTQMCRHGAKMTIPRLRFLTCCGRTSRWLHLVSCRTCGL